MIWLDHLLPPLLKTKKDSSPLPFFIFNIIMPFFDKNKKTIFQKSTIKAIGSKG